MLSFLSTHFINISEGDFVMTSHNLKEGFKIVACIVLIAVFYFLIVKNQPLHDEVARTVEEATT